jgi:hypothetical protein
MLSSRNSAAVSFCSVEYAFQSTVQLTEGTELISDSKVTREIQGKTVHTNLSIISKNVIVRFGG